MKRREFIAGLGSAAAWPVVAWAQQPALPVIGYLTDWTIEVDAVPFNDALAQWRSGATTDLRAATIEHATMDSLIHINAIRRCCGFVVNPPPKALI